MPECTFRTGTSADIAGCYYVCLKTGNYGQDGEPYYLDDPDALGRMYVGPYLLYEPSLSRVLEDDQGICGYAFGALDSRHFYARYESEWRPKLCATFPAPTGNPQNWTRAQLVHHGYHHPDYFCPEPYAEYPSHLHVDLLERAQGCGHGRRLLEDVMEALKRLGSPGAHLGVSLRNQTAMGFYRRLGFHELVQVGAGAEGCLYFGKRL